MGRKTQKKQIPKKKTQKKNSKPKKFTIRPALLQKKSQNQQIRSQKIQKKYSDMKTKKKIMDEWPRLAKGCLLSMKKFEKENYSKINPKKTIVQKKNAKKIITKKKSKKQ